MSGLALIALELGAQVSGSDSAPSSFTAMLRRRDMNVYIGHRSTLPATVGLVVFSSAVPTDNIELVAAKNRRVPLRRRGDFLADLSECFRQVVCVAGSHGKTTVTAMIAHILVQQGLDPGYAVGGEIVGCPYNAGAGAGEILVAEVDESDGSQGSMSSSQGLILNIDDDHCWSLGGVSALEHCFQAFGMAADRLLAVDSAASRRLFATHPDATFVSGRDSGSDLRLSVPGRHNRQNAKFAIAVAVRLGVERSAAQRSLVSFAGVDRRLTERYRSDRVVVVEDYAHHPAEVRASLSAIQDCFPERRVIAVFQPHRHERVLRYGRAFAAELAQADRTFVLPTFGAWTDCPDHAASRAIAGQIPGNRGKYIELAPLELAVAVAATVRCGDVVVVMGAGDVSSVIGPLIAALRLRDR